MTRMSNVNAAASAARISSRTLARRACSRSIQGFSEAGACLVGKFELRGVPSVVKKRLRTAAGSSTPASAFSKIACSLRPLGWSVFSEPSAKPFAAAP